VAKTIHVELTNKSINSAIKELRQYKLWVETKERELRLRLAQLGATVASIQFSRAIYNGSNDVTVRVDDTGSVAVIYAEGESVAFIEFGSGAKYGYGHPQAGEFGVGPGTYSDGPDGKGKWDNPNGWCYGHGQHSYGNPPAMAMYGAVQAITEQITKIAREVFSGA
jgi:hypothetical protein